MNLLLLSTMTPRASSLEPPASKRGLRVDGHISRRPTLPVTGESSAEHLIIMPPPRGLVSLPVLNPSFISLLLSLFGHATRDKLPSHQMRSSLRAKKIQSYHADVVAVEQDLGHLARRACVVALSS